MKILLIFALVLAPPAAALYEAWAHDCPDYKGSFTSDSPYKANLDSVLAQIDTANAPSGFYSLSAGQDPDQAYVRALCRGDMLNPAKCRACLASLKATLTAACPYHKMGIIWADDCMLYYADYMLYGKWEESPKEDSSTELGVGGNVDHFAEVVEALFMTLPNKTATLHNGMAFAVGEASVNASHTIYALAECTPDLIPTNCLGCLYWNMYYILYPLRGQTGARVVSPACSIRYELYKFYAVSSSSGSAWSINPKITAIWVLAALLALTLIVFATLIYLVVTRRKQEKLMEKATQVTSGKWDIQPIKRATRNFAKPLGISGKSRVYRGDLHGNAIAVKKIEAPGLDPREFRKAVSKAMDFHNTNLATIIGYCVQDNERFVIYDFYSKGSLDQILFDPKYNKERAKLDWQKRYTIIGGLADGLQYLHKLKTCHHDLKPANVLLDDKWMPKITDIGTGNSFQEDDGRTHANTQSEAAVVLIPQSHAAKAREKGTIAYMAPEYLEGGPTSIKSDVYSFGVIVLEIVTGKKRDVVAGQDDLISSVRTTFSGETWLQIIDPQIKPNTNSDSPGLQMKQCIDVALKCVDVKPEQRPDMSSVVKMLAKLDHPSTPEHIPNSSPQPLLPNKGRSSSSTS